MAAANEYTGWQTGLDSPARRAETVTPSDSTELSYISRGLYVGGAGDVVAVMAGDDTVTFKSVPAGTVLPICIKRVNNTNTTATYMVALR